MKKEINELLVNENTYFCYDPECPYTCEDHLQIGQLIHSDYNNLESIEIELECFKDRSKMYYLDYGDLENIMVNTSDAIWEVYANNDDGYYFIPISKEPIDKSTWRKQTGRIEAALFDFIISGHNAGYAYARLDDIISKIEEYNCILADKLFDFYWEKFIDRWEEAKDFYLVKILDPEYMSWYYGGPVRKEFIEESYFWIPDVIREEDKLTLEEVLSKLYKCVFEIGKANAILIANVIELDEKIVDSDEYIYDAFGWMKKCFFGARAHGLQKC